MGMVHLQGVGRVPAIEAGDLQAGMVTVWNYGYREQIITIEPRGEKQIKVWLVSLRNGEKFTRVLNKSRLVAIDEA
jgi:hypothetical protein